WGGRSEGAGEGERVFWDDDIRGFGVRVRASGGRSFLFQYRVRGQARDSRITLPIAADPKNVRAAREKAADMWADVRKGIDPRVEKIEDRKRESATFGAKVDEYLEWKKTTPTKKTRKV